MTRSSHERVLVSSMHQFHYETHEPTDALVTHGGLTPDIKKLLISSISIFHRLVFLRYAALSREMTVVSGQDVVGSQD